MAEKKRDVWFSLRKSLHCKSEPSDVHNPKTKKQLSSILTKKAPRSGCSRSIANLKDVIHGSKRHVDKPTTCSPRSIGSSDFLNPITHEVILSNSTCELKITGYDGGVGGGDGGGRGGAFVGNLRPGTPMHHLNNGGVRSNLTPGRKTSTNGLVEGAGNGNILQKRGSFEKDGNNGVTCHKCGEQFVKWESLESHHLSMHAGINILT